MSELKQHTLLVLLFVVFFFCAHSAVVGAAQSTGQDLDEASNATTTTQTTAQTTTSSTQLSMYKTPDSWFIRALEAFFRDVDWKMIAAAQVEIEKVVRKINSLVRNFHWKQQQQQQQQHEEAEGRRSERDSSSSSSSSASRFFTSGWWKPKGSAGNKLDALQLEESSNVKEMLERVACFLGYLRILNHSNEALAELDAAKVVSNLWSSNKRNSSVFSTWFG